MAKNNDNRNRLLSALITLLLGAGIVALLLFTSLHYQYPPEDAEQLNLLQDTIMFGGEYVELGDFPDPSMSEELATQGEETPQQSDAQDDVPQDVGQNDLNDQGAINEPPKPQVVNNNQQSPMKVTEQPPKKPQAEKKTPTPAQPQKSGNPQPAASTNPKPQPQAPNSNINNRVSNAFGKNNGSGAGKQGSPGGAVDGGEAGRPGVSGLDGYTLEYFPKAKCPAPGTVVIRVTVSPSGSVSKASIVGGSVTDKTTRDRCLGLARQSRFRVPKGQSIERTGTLTYTIR